MWSVSIFRYNDPSEHCLPDDFEHAGRYVEMFIVSSCAEHRRQHERMTRTDREPKERWQRYSPSNFRVRHLVSVAMDE
jgi:hypothetical protein